MANILVCDDAAFMRTSLKMMLEKNGHTVIGEAVNGEDALDKYMSLHPDLVTMDITMPDVDGLQGVKMIKEHDPAAKVIMISAMGQESMVREAILAGAKTFIVKPFKEDFVIETIKKIL